MDVSEADSALHLKAAVARVFSKASPHFSVQQAVKVALLARCRDREDLVRNLFSTRDCKLYLNDLDAMAPSTEEFGSIVRRAAEANAPRADALLGDAAMQAAVADMRLALSCTLSEARQKAHWEGHSAVPVATFVALHFEDPEPFVGAAVWNAVRADQRRVEELRQNIAKERTQLLLLSEAAEALSAGL